MFYGHITFKAQEQEVSLVYRCCINQTVKIAANTLMTFAGKVCTQEMERQSRCNVV